MTLRYDFSEKKIEHLKKIIIKMVHHYLNGNKLAHLEYFVSVEAKGIKNARKIFKKIINSYIEFMEFDQKEFKEIRKEFIDEDAIFSILKKFITL